MLSHTGEKMFACKEFNYYCTIASRLKTHILIDLRDGTGWDGTGGGDGRQGVGGGDGRGARARYLVNL